MPRLLQVPTLFLRFIIFFLHLLSPWSSSKWRTNHTHCRRNSFVCKRRPVCLPPSSPISPPLPPHPSLCSSNCVYVSESYAEQQHRIMSACLSICPCRRRLPPCLSASSTLSPLISCPAPPPSPAPVCLLLLCACVCTSFA